MVFSLEQESIFFSVQGGKIGSLDAGQRERDRGNAFHRAEISAK
jgi:hypothetical protein